MLPASPPAPKRQRPGPGGARAAAGFWGPRGAAPPPGGHPHPPPGGPGAAAERSGPASVFSGPERRIAIAGREHERPLDDADAGVRLLEPDATERTQHAVGHRRVVHRVADDLRVLDVALGVDRPLRRDLALQARLGHQLHLVAGAQRGGAALHVLGDVALVAAARRAATGDVHLGDLLGLLAADADVGVAARTATGVDRAETVDTTVAAAATARTGAAEAHAAGSVADDELATLTAHRDRHLAVQGAGVAGHDGAEGARERLLAAENLGDTEVLDVDLVDHLAVHLRNLGLLVRVGVGVAELTLFARGLLARGVLFVTL